MGNFIVFEVIGGSVVIIKLEIALASGFVKEKEVVKFLKFLGAEEIGSCSLKRTITVIDAVGYYSLDIPANNIYYAPDSCTPESCWGSSPIYLDFFNIIQTILQ